MGWCSVAKPLTYYFSEWYALEKPLLPYPTTGFFWTFWKKLKAKKTQGSRKTQGNCQKLKDFFEKLKFPPTPKLFSCGLKKPLFLPRFRRDSSNTTAARLTTANTEFWTFKLDLTWMKNDDEFSEGKTQRNLKKLKEISKKLKEFGKKFNEIFEKLKKLPTFSWNLLRKNVQKKACLSSPWPNPPTKLPNFDVSCPHHHNLKNPYIPILFCRSLNLQFYAV